MERRAPRDIFSLARVPPAEISGGAYNDLRAGWRNVMVKR
jgi:hypothetical protein